MAGYDVMFLGMCGDGGRCAPTMREIISVVPGGVREVLRDVDEPDVNLNLALPMEDVAFISILYNCPPSTPEESVLFRLCYLRCLVD